MFLAVVEGRGAVGCLEGADDEEEAHHQEGPDEHCGAATEAIEVDDCGKGEENVQDVLDGSG